MLRSEAITIIKRGLGYRPTQDASIISALKEAQRQLELGHTLPNFLLQYDSVISVTGLNPVIALPTGFIRFHDDYEAYYVNTNGAKVFIPRKNYTEAYQAYVASGDENGDIISQVYDYPQVMVAQGKTSALLFPTPRTSFTLYLTHYKADATLDTEVENKWLLNAPDVLIGMAGMTVAGDVRDKDALASFSRRANLGGKSLMGDIIEDELAGRPLVMGRNN